MPTNKVDIENQKENARKTLNAFMEAWQKKKWGDMKECCQLTWIFNARRKAVMFLHDYFCGKDILKFTITKMGDISPSCFKCEVEMEIKEVMSGIEKRMRIFPMVICEKKDYKASPYGTWGVNPISVIKGETV